MQKGIIVAGPLILDRHYAVDTFPDEGRLVSVHDIHEDVGGTGNLIIDLAKIDAALPVRVSTVLGRGSAGRSIIKALDAYPNIDKSGIVKSDEGHTPLTIVIDADDTHQRTFFYYAGVSDTYGERHIDWDALEGDIFQLEYLLLTKGIDAPDGEYGTHAARILAQARRRGMKTSIDIVSRKGAYVKDIVCASLKYTDYCTINELEAQEVTGIPLESDGKIIKNAMRPVLEKIAEYGVSRWIIIHAASCSFGMDCATGTCFTMPSLRFPHEKIKGKTGAGDAYCCGVLYAAYRGQSIIDAMKLGTACATCSLSEINGTDGMRAYGEALALYDAYKCSVEFEKL